MGQSGLGDLCAAALWCNCCPLQLCSEVCLLWDIFKFLNENEGIQEIVGCRNEEIERLFEDLVEQLIFQKVYERMERLSLQRFWALKRGNGKDFENLSPDRTFAKAGVDYVVDFWSCLLSFICFTLASSRDVRSVCLYNAFLVKQYLSSRFYIFKPWLIQIHKYAFQIDN